MYYSGAKGCVKSGVPECVLGDKAYIMLSYEHFHKAGKPAFRFREVIKARQKTK